MTLTFNPVLVRVKVNPHATYQGHRWTGSAVRAQTVRQTNTDKTDNIISFANAGGKNFLREHTIPAGNIRCMSHLQANVDFGQCGMIMYVHVSITKHLCWCIGVLGLKDTKSSRSKKASWHWPNFIHNFKKIVLFNLTFYFILINSKSHMTDMTITSHSLIKIWMTSEQLWVTKPPLFPVYLCPSFLRSCSVSHWHLLLG